MYNICILHNEYKWKQFYLSQNFGIAGLKYAYRGYLSRGRSKLSSDPEMS